MRDGFYLSTYLTPPGLPRLLGTWLRHDNNIALWSKRGDRVELLNHWELERITGMKQHGIGLLDRADFAALLDGLLAERGIRQRDLVAIWGTPGLSTGDDDALSPRGTGVSRHAVGHLYSCVLLDSDLFFGADIVGLAVDGGPDYVLETGYPRYPYAGCVVRRGKMDLFPVESPGQVYSEARRRFQLREGTLMALATATPARGSVNRQEILATCRLDEDVNGSSRRILDLITAQVRRGLEAADDPRFTAEEHFVSAVMKEVQAVSVAVMERNVERILGRHGLDPTTTYLALSGGYALNCPTNSHLMDRYGFRGLLAPPCVNDGGQAVGIGLAAFHRGFGGRRFDFRFPGAYRGQADRDLDAALSEHASFVVETAPLDLDIAVRDLCDGPVVWFSGASETGPRALGNRSILADPRPLAAKDELNRLKQREWWRPVAPVVLEEHLADWFENARPSPYMLETRVIRARVRDRIPAVAHLDDSARIQSVNRSQHPVLYDLLRRFHAVTGVPMLCNTSLNDKSEPIVNTIAEAMNFALRKRVRVGYFNGVRVVFGGFDAYPVDGVRPRRHEPFSGCDPARAEVVRKALNPRGLGDAHLYTYLRDPVLRDRYDLTDDASAREYDRVAHVLHRLQPAKRIEAESALSGNTRHFDAHGRAVWTGLDDLDVIPEPTRLIDDIVEAPA